MQPQISIIVPVYNSSKYLDRCIQSILSQSFTDFEILLINDGSTDNSGVICKKYACQDSRIKFYDKINEGVSATRQFGIDHSTGVYSTQIDSDDWIDKHYLKDMYETAIKTNADLVYAPFIKEYPHRSEKVSMYKTNNAENFLKGILKAQAWGSLCNKLLKIDIIKENQIKFPTQIKMWEDLVFICKYLLFSKRIIYCKKNFYHYTQYNNNSLCSSIYSYDVVKHTLAAVTDLQNFYKKNNSYQKFKFSLNILKLFSKQRLLFDRHYRNIGLWINSFPESNIYIIPFLYYAIRTKLHKSY